jgi:hypothetical protein
MLAMLAWRGDALTRRMHEQHAFADLSLDKERCFERNLAATCS